MLSTETLDALALPEAESGSEASQSRKRVMIVDDNTFFSKCLAALINHEQDLMVCDIANSYIQLVKDLIEARPQLLLIDVCIGSDNGIEIARRLRSMKVDVPILLTSSVAEPTRQELQEIGQCGFISKFQKPSDFLREIRSFIS